MSFDNITSGHESNNETGSHGIKSDTLKYFWAGYYILVVMSSWIGDIAILVGSIKYKAFKLHKFIVVIIQHIAVCDLMLSTGTELIRFVSLLFGKWVLGKFLCQWFNYLQYYSSSASVFLVCTMTTSKLLLLKYPLRTSMATSKNANMLCGICWVLAFIVPVTMLLVDEKDVSFIFGSYLCMYGFSSEIWHYLRPILAVPLLFAPICLVIVTSINLLVIAKRVALRGRENLKWQGIITTVLTAAVFCISYLPFCMFLMVESILDENLTSRVYDNVNRVAVAVNSLNIVSNFFIYSLTVHSFRTFVLSRLRSFSRLFTSPIRLVQVWLYFRTNI